MNRSNTTILLFQIFLGILMFLIFYWVRFIDVPEEYVDISETGSWEIQQEERALVYTWQWKQFPIIKKCPENFMLDSLESSMNTPCIPQSAPHTQKYSWLRMIGIDATFANDAISLSYARDYFTKEWAIFYSTQSAGTAPGKWVLRINSDHLFSDQKVFYIFYNDRKEISSFQRNKMIADLTNLFPHLRDIRLHSFTDFDDAMNKKPSDTAIGRLFYYIGDCQYKVHGGCSAKLTTTGKYRRFTPAMVTDDIDILFAVPTTMKKTRRLDGLFKSTIYEE